MEKDTVRGWGVLFSALLLFLIPLGTRRVIADLGSAGDFSRLIVSAIEVLGLAFVAWWLWARQRLAPANFPIGWAVVFLAMALASALAGVSRALALASWVELAIAVGVAAALTQIGASSRRWLTVVAWTFVLGGVLQAAVALGQFTLQHDLGLQILGESRIAPDIAGVAKLDTAAGKIVRAYGTFPHPNLLAAYLGVAILAWWWLWVRRSESPAGLRDAALLGVGALLLAGFAVTFSRLSLVALVTGLAMVSWRVWVVPGLRRRFGRQARLGALFVIGCGLGLLFFLPQWSSRIAIDGGEQAVALRLEYVRSAWHIIADRPFFGVGPGVFVQALPRYAPELTESWQRQPVHNLWLLMLVELGVVGFVAFIVFIWRLLRPLSIRAESGEHALAKALAVGWLAILIVFSLGDHFFWTLPQGRILFWVVLAVVAGASFRYRQAI
ncbi:O-antigen ligase family protein [Candidatus Parcubacteria bacterium]|nr:O-antigen ligase family protein [Candidatus Parcubacteria bacterium]